MINIKPSNQTALIINYTIFYYIRFMKKRIRKRFKQINWSAINNIVTKSPPHDKKSYVDNFRYCEYNQEISEKFYKFLDLMLNIPFEFYNDETESFSLNFNLNSYYTNNNVDEYLNILIKSLKKFSFNKLIIMRNI